MKAVCLLKEIGMKPKSLVLMLGLVLFSSHGLASELTDLAGKVHSGSLKSLTSSSAVLVTESGPVKVPVDQLMKIVIAPRKEEPRQKEDPTIRLTITDHSELTGSRVDSDGLKVTIETKTLGELQVPARKVKAVLYSWLDKNTQKQWDNLLLRKFSDDLLVVKKGEKLNFLAGVVTQYKDKKLMLLYEGNNIPVRLEKVFGIIHPLPFSPPDQAKCKIETVSGDSLFVEQVTLENDSFRVQTGPNHFISIPQNDIHLLDFSLGRIVYLSDMPPEGVEYTPYFDTVWEYQRDKTIDGTALKLGNREYSKGLWIHSKTKLTYRLAGDFSRFQALMGIDASVAKSGLGDVHVTISADDDVLLDERVTAFTAPRKLDLDVRGHRFLHILVDFGEGLNIGDRLDLVDARLIK